MLPQVGKTGTAVAVLVTLLCSAGAGVCVGGMVGVAVGSGVAGRGVLVTAVVAVARRLATSVGAMGGSLTGIPSS